MKRLSLVLTVFALTLPQPGQAGWWRTYGGAGYDVGNCVQITSDGNYIISGAKGLNLFVLKVDTTGDLKWQHTYGMSNTELWRWVEETSDGGFIIAPRTPSLLKINSQGDTMWSKDYGIESHCVQVTSDGGYAFTGGFSELILAKTDSEGDTLWTRKFSVPGNVDNVGYFLQETKDKGFIITGVTNYIEEGGYGWSNLWLVKTDSSGNEQWRRIYGEQTYDYVSKGYCVRQTKDSGYIITGLNPKGLWLLRTDSLGDTLWTKVYGNPIGGEGYSVVATLDGGYIVTGTTDAVFLNADRKLCLLKTDSQGDTLWTRIYDGEIGYGVQQTSDSGYIVVGGTVSYGAGNSDVFLFKTDSFGLLAIIEDQLSETGSNWWLISPVGSQIKLNFSNSPQGFRASIYDVSGRRIDELASQSSSGTLVWGQGYPLGVYFLRVTGNPSKTRKIVIVR